MLGILRGLPRAPRKVIAGERVGTGAGGKDDSETAYIQSILKNLSP